MTKKNFVAKLSKLKIEQIVLNCGFFGIKYKIYSFKSYIQLQKG